MSGRVKQSDAREIMQIKCFGKWVNVQLNKKNLKLDDLTKELNDGVLLHHLLQIISLKDVGKISLNPKTRHHKVNNLYTCFQFLKQENIYLENIQAEDIADCDIKLILGLIWILILRYQIKAIHNSSREAKNEILKWWKSSVGTPITNLTSSFSDGFAFCELINRVNPNLINFSNLNKNDKRKNLETAIQIFEKEWNIPPLIDIEDLVNNPDEKSMMLYSSMIKEALEKRGWEPHSVGNDKTILHNNQPQLPVELSGKIIGPGRAYGQGIEKAITNIEDSFYIEVVKPEGEIELNIDGPHSVEASMDEEEPGVYLVKYVATVPGSYFFRIDVDGMPLQGSPFLVTISPPTNSSLNPPAVTSSPFSSTSPARAYGLGLTSAKTFRSSQFRVEDDSHSHLQVNITGPETIPIKQFPNKDGFEVQYIPRIPGKYTIELTLDGKPIYGSPFSLTVIDSETYKVYGTGIIEGRTGQTNKFKIEFDAFESSVDIDVQINGPQKVNSFITETKKGMYEVSYQVSTPGNYTINVLFNGKAIKESPFDVAIKEVENDKIKVYGTGLQDGIVNTPTKFFVELKERDDELEINIDGPASVEVEMDEINDGKYEINYKAQTPGTYAISINLNGEAIHNSPFPVNLIDPNILQNSHNGSISNSPSEEPGDMIIPKKDLSYRVTGSALEKGTVCQTSKFIVELLDLEEVDIDVQINGPQTVNPFITEIKKGMYEVSYQVSTPGNYTINVLFNGQAIKESPFTASIEDTNNAVFVNPKAIPLQVNSPPFSAKAYGPGLQKGYINQMNVFEVEIFDPDSKLEINIDGPNQVKVDLIEKNDRTFEIQYIPIVPGSYLVRIDCDDSPAEKGPFLVNIVEPVIRVEGEGIQEGKVGKACSFKILVEDGDGELDVQIKGPLSSNNKPQITSKKKGEYEVVYEPSVPGIYNISILFNDTPISGSPFRAIIQNKTVKIYGNGIENGVANGLARYVIVEGVDSPVEVKVIGKNGVNIPVAITPDMTPGKYSASYGVIMPGKYEVQILNNKKQNLGSSPYEITLELDKIQSREVRKDRDDDNSQVTVEDEHDLYTACYNGYYELAEKLLRKGVNPNCRDEGDWTPLHAACAQGHKHIVKLLVEDYNAEINILNKAGTTPLFQATKHGRRSIARFLVSRKADVNLSSKGGWRPIHAACYHEFSKSTAWLLTLEVELSPQCEEMAGYTPLHMLICTKVANYKLIELMIDSGADIKAVDKNLDTPLHLAVYWGHLDVVKLLVSRGANLHVLNKKARNPLAVAQRYKELQIGEYLAQQMGKPAPKFSEERIRQVRTLSLRGGFPPLPESFKKK